MRRRQKDNRCHICGRRSAKYYYSAELAKVLGISQWQGVYLCPECYEELGQKAKGGVRSLKNGRTTNY